MHLKIGELSKYTGLTVRTLHHYDSLGLLVPPSRSDGGYRLYDLSDIRRLYRIQVLRSLGLSLDEVAVLLCNETDDFRDIIKRQIAELDRQVAQVLELQGRLKNILSKIAKGKELALDDLLAILQLMIANPKRDPAAK